MKRSNWCTCEDTMDEFGGCVPNEENTKCIACGKRISKSQLEKFKKRMLFESGWDIEFETQLKEYWDYEGYGGFGFDEDTTDENMGSIIEKYIGENKVKLNCKDGLIQIERI